MARRVILLQGDPVFTEEYASSEAVTPGHLLMIEAAGTVKKNTANAANIAVMVALERDESGADIDDAYASGDTIKAATLNAGSRFYGFLPSGQNVAKGDYLSTDALGQVTKTGVTATVRIGRALDTLDLTGLVTASQRLRVEVV
jgi:hypothetical protein